METKTDRTVADFGDANSKNEETIISLKGHNQQLEMKHETMTLTLLQKFTTGRELQRVVEANTAGKEEAKELRRTVRHLKQHVENLLDMIQNIEKDLTRHREAERDIRAVSHRAQSTIWLLEYKLALRKDQVRDLAKQLDQGQQGIIPAGTNCAALDAFQQENEELRNSLQAERDEKTGMQATLDRLDNDNMDLSIKYDSIDAELIEQKKSSSTLRNSTEAAMYELRMLRKVAH
jgi:chromosome segregation ATPase